MAGEVTPDVGTMALTWGTEFGSKGQMVNLPEAFPEEFPSQKALMFPAVQEATEYRGSAYATPFDMTLQVLYYRTDLVEPPKTWDELAELLKKLNKEKKSMIIDWGALEWIGFSPFLWQSGGSYYNEEKTKSALGAPEAVRALTFYGDLFRTYKVPQAGQSLAQGLRSGEYPLGMGGSWLVNSIAVDAPELQGKWAVASLPAGPSGKPTAFIGGRSMGIFSNSKLKEEAWKFIKYLSEKETQKKIYETVAASHNIYMPPNVQAWDILPMEENLKNALRAQALEAQAPPSILGWDDSTRFIVEAIQKVILQGEDAQKVLLQAAAAMDERIEK
jgi:ABC-type glycerol-3-phosphate transport system substrate-binding protein